MWNVEPGPEMYDRREFLKSAALGGLTLACDPGAASTDRPQTPLTTPAPPPLAAEPLQTVRMGFVGVGHQGTSHVQNFLRIPGVEIRAICDVTPANAER